MKRLLTLFNVFTFSFSTSGGGLTSCKIGANHEADGKDNKDDKDNEFKEPDPNTINKYLENEDDVKNKVSKHFSTWWEGKARLNVKDYFEDTDVFSNLVNKLFGQSYWQIGLFGNKIKDYGFVDHLINEFLKEFNNFNDKLVRQYPQYYSDSKPLSILYDKFQIWIKYINLDKVAEVIGDPSRGTKGILIEFYLPYTIIFNKQEVKDTLDGLAVISDNPDVVGNLQIKLQDYMINFIDNIFNKLDYNKILDINNKNFNDIESIPDLFWNIIEPEIKKMDVWSVLNWAGEGYDSQKLTWQNFLEFYKTAPFSYQINFKDNYYVQANIESFISSNKTEIKLKKPCKFLVAKEQVDEKLIPFGKAIMDFWHYYKLETYKEKVIFNMTKNNFDSLSKVTNNFVAENLSWSNITVIFSSVFDSYNNRENVNNKVDPYFSLLMPELHKFNLIKKENSIIVQWFKNQLEM